MRPIFLLLTLSLAGIAAPAPALAQDECAAVTSEIADLEKRLGAGRSRVARGLFSNLAGAALGSVPYASVGAGPVAQAVADSAQATTRDAALDAVRGGDAEPSVEPSADPRADRKRVKQLRREAHTMGCS